MVRYSTDKGGRFFTEECEVTEEGEEVLTEVYERISGIPYGKITDNKIKEVEEKLPVTFIGSGSQRSVFAIDGKDCVVKIGLFEDSYQIENEVLNWTEQIPDGVKDRFAPVVDYDEKRYGWLVIPEAELEPSKKEMRATLEDIILDHGLDLRDFNEGNFGVIDGRTKMIDYGFVAHPVRKLEGWDSRQDLFDYATGVMEGTADEYR